MKNFDIKLISMDFDDVAGKENEFNLLIENVTEEKQSGTIAFSPPYLHVEPSDYFEVEIKELNPGETKELRLEYKLLMGGRYTFYYWDKSSFDRTLSKESFFISGPGVYSGDTHTHSKYSDGTSTLEENRESMLEKGHSFLYSTDHNTLEHAEEIEEFQTTEPANRFLQIAGWEYTSKFSHALSYGEDKVYDPHHITEKNNLVEWQKFVDDTKENGLIFLAHPYEAPKYEFGDNLLMNIKDITGIEVWNGLNHHALSYQNGFAFKIWDKLNAKGDGHYIGNAVSDAHSKEKQGNPFIKGYMGELNRDGVHKLLQSGQFFGSNGPEIKFSIDDKSIGETLKLSDKSQLSKVNITVFDPVCSIESIVLYKGEISTDNKPFKKMSKVKEIYTMSKEERRVFNIIWYTEISPDEFYRVEVVSEKGAVAHDPAKSEQEKGFAFTNPIWIESES